MKRFTGVVLMLTGVLITVSRFGELLASYTTPLWMTAGLSGMLIFLGIIVLGHDYRSRNRSIENRHY
jgi:hypothetical protein